MLRASGVFAIALLVDLVVVSGVARAGNSDDVVAGSDVALTGGAVVANVHTGGAMWFNPAGVARLDARSVDLTGAVLSYNIISAPGVLSIESGEQSEGDFSALQAIPRALTFVASPRPALRWGIGFFFSRSLSRFLQDSVSTQSDSLEPSEFYATADETKSLYHLSSALAWKKSDKFLLGGGFDIVVATQRLTEIISGAYGVSADGVSGAGGTFNRSLNKAISGGGMQMKLGVQWAPIPEVRIGWMAATPSYLVYLNNETTETEQLSPPGGDPRFSGTQIDDLSGTWSGVERGLTRLGAAYLGKWGWIEADLIVGFPAGFSTDFSPENTPSDFGDTKINFYSLTFGIDFANREKPPERGEDGFYLAFAVAFKYSYGSGEIAGLLFPSDFPNPPTQPLVDVTINEFGVNLAVKAAF
jgi:hypothetical protein